MADLMQSCVGAARPPRKLPAEVHRRFGWLARPNASCPTVDQLLPSDRSKLMRSFRLVGIVDFEELESEG